VELKRADIPGYAGIRFIFSGKGLSPSVMVFKYKDGKLSHLASRDDTVTIYHLKELKDEGSHLFAVPINSKYHDPYSTALSEGKLKIEVFQELTYNFRFRAQFCGTIKKSRPGEPDETEKKTFHIKAKDLTGKLVFDTDTTFQAGWDRPHPDYSGYRDIGSLSITLINKLSKATQVKFSQTVEGPDQQKEIVDITATDIPGQIDPRTPDNYLKYEVTGEQTCNHLSDVEWEADFMNVSWGGRMTLVPGSLFCNEDSEIFFYLWQDQ
jgi:hypothetical protein